MIEQCQQISDYRNRARLVFLYSRIPPYLTSVLRALMSSGRVSAIDVVHWDHGDPRGNMYRPECVDGVQYLQRSVMQDNDLLAFLRQTTPAIVYVPGWMDSGYLRALRRYRRETKTVVVAGIDDQWSGSLRQHMGALYYRWAYRDLIDVMWVAGGPQRVFAERFGYSGNDVIPYLLSADVNRITVQPIRFERRFLFVGRFDPVKGLDLLIEAYRNLPESVRLSWTLELVGDGPLRESLAAKNAPSGLRIHPYLQPHELISFLANGGVACFPSLHEQWGVAIHELAAVGCPLLLSDACGAAAEFLIDGHNGYRCRAGDAISLSAAMYRIATSSEAQIQLFADRSRQLAARITPELSAASLLSLLDRIELNP